MTLCKQKFATTTKSSEFADVYGNGSSRLNSEHFSRWSRGSVQLDENYARRKASNRIGKDGKGVCIGAGLPWKTNFIFKHTN